MKPIEYLITRFTTQKLLEEAERQGNEETDQKRVEQIPGFRWFFRGTALIGFIAGTCIIVFAHEVFAGIVFYLLFGGLSVPILISYHTCYIDYDEEGFVRSNFFGIKKRYSYQEVTGYSDSDGNVEIEVNGKKRIRLNETWVNRRRFATMIRSKCPRVRKLVASPFGMSLNSIERSYKNGTFRKAMVVLTDAKSQFEFAHYRLIHKLLVSLGIASVIGMYVLSSEAMLESFGKGPMDIVMLGVNVLTAISWYLYFRRPQYFSAREKPSGIQFDETVEKNHKKCTLVWMGFLSMLANMCFFVGCDLLKPDAISFGKMGIALIMAGLFAFVLIYLFPKYSEEYKKYRIGYVYYTFEVLAWTFGIFMASLGLFL